MHNPNLSPTKTAYIERVISVSGRSGNRQIEILISWPSLTCCTKTFRCQISGMSKIDSLFP